MHSHRHGTMDTLVCAAAFAVAFFCQPNQVGGNSPHRPGRRPSVTINIPFELPLITVMAFATDIEDPAIDESEERENEDGMTILERSFFKDYEIPPLRKGSVVFLHPQRQLIKTMIEDLESLKSVWIQSYPAHKDNVDTLINSAESPDLFSVDDFDDVDDIKFSLKKWLSSTNKYHLANAKFKAREILNRNQFGGRDQKIDPKTTERKLTDFARAVIELAKTPELPQSYAEISDDDYLRLSGSWEQYEQLRKALQVKVNDPGEFEVESLSTRDDLTFVVMRSKRTRGTNSKNLIVPETPPKKSSDGMRLFGEPISETPVHKLRR